MKRSCSIFLTCELAAILFIVQGWVQQQDGQQTSGVLDLHPAVSKPVRDSELIFLVLHAMQILSAQS